MGYGRVYKSNDNLLPGQSKERSKQLTAIWNKSFAADKSKQSDARLNAKPSNAKDVHYLRAKQNAKRWNERKRAT